MKCETKCFYACFGIALRVTQLIWQGPGRCKISRVLLTPAAPLQSKILGVLNATIILILRYVGGAIAPLAPPALFGPSTFNSSRFAVS